MSEHTQEPWKEAQGPIRLAELKGEPDDVVGADGQPICCMNVARPDTEWIANRNLIAAAPDLLRECRAIKAQLDRVEKALHEHDGSDLSNASVSFAVEPEGRIALDAAIAKAVDPSHAQEPRESTKPNWNIRERRQTWP